MAIAFIHGVSNRPGSEYEAGKDARDALIRRFLIPAMGLDVGDDIENPHWGEHGASSKWGYPWLPGDGAVALGSEDDRGAGVAAEAAVATGAAPGEDLVLHVARTHGLVEAVDVLVGGPLASNSPSANEAAKMADTAYAATTYATSNPNPAWLTEVHSDAELVDRLRAEIQASTEADDVVALGAGDWWDNIKEGLDRISNAPNNLAGKAGVALLRGLVHRNATMFVGDLLVYLTRRGTAESPGPIVQQVLSGFDRAAARGPLVVIGHSLGGVIAYDVLTHFRPDLTVEVLVTVGSQVAVFEDLKLFVDSKQNIGPGELQERAPKPAKVKHWINVYDRGDPLSFDASEVFADVQDYEYSGGFGVDRAHGGYFIRPSFYARLAQRIEQGSA